MHNHQSQLSCILNAAEGQLDIVLCLKADTEPSTPADINSALLSAHSFYAPNKGAEILTPALQNLCSIHKIVPADIKYFACVHGPGSFTGIRLLMSTVAAIRRITGASNAGIDYMQALAQSLALQILVMPKNILLTNKSAHICVLTHARRNLVHCQHFSINFLPDTLPLATALEQVRLITPLEAAKELCHVAEEEIPVFVLGSGLQKNSVDIENYYYKEKLPASHDIHFVPMVHPTVSALQMLAGCAQYHNNDLEPLYVRPCDAVENLSHIAEKQGMDAKTAHNRLQELLQKNICNTIFN